MKLTYRGQAYEVSVPVQFSVNAGNQLKLIYRGLAYYTSPRSAAISEAVGSVDSTVTFIYRGNTYKRKLKISQAHQPTRPINWRYQTGES